MFRNIDYLHNEKNLFMKSKRLPKGKCQVQTVSAKMTNENVIKLKIGKNMSTKLSQ